MDKIENSLTTFVPLAFKRRGVRQLAVTETPAFDTKFIECLGLAFYWQQLIDNGVMASGSEIARQEGLHFTNVNELLRLTLLAPDIIDQLMAGRQPRRLKVKRFQRYPLPVEWQAQRDIIASFE